MLTLWGDAATRLDLLEGSVLQVGDNNAESQVDRERGREGVCRSWSEAVYDGGLRIVVRCWVAGAALKLCPCTWWQGTCVILNYFEC